MADNESGTDISVTTDAPPCPKCGAATFATTRRMRTHILEGATAVPRDHSHPVWRCMRCSNEVMRST